MKELKEYLHYYYQQPSLEAIIVPGQELHFEQSTITSRTLFNVEAGLSVVKPILRRLEDMTEEEIHDVAALCYGDEDFIITYKGMGYQDYDHQIHNSVKCIKIETYCEHPEIKNWLPSALLQIDYEDSDMPIIIGRFSNSGKELCDDVIAKPFELTHYLLKQQFDLFGLIDAGLAIDAKTLKQ